MGEGAQAASGPGEPGLEGYLPIGEHGLIGDLHTVALVGTEGTIDWFCCPSFDSPSVFAALLDRNRGGYWALAPRERVSSRQLYFPDTNVLITRFLHPQGLRRSPTSCRSAPQEARRCWSAE